MKNKLIVLVSLSLNILLTVAFELRSLSRVQPATRAPGVSLLTSPSPRVIEKVTTNVVAVMAPAKPFDWRTVESEDYRQYVANLRGLGCPEKTIRDIIIADVNELYRKRAKGGTNRFEYWKPGLFGNALSEQQIAEQQELVKEKCELLKVLLGRSYSPEADPAAGQFVSPMEQMTRDFLSPEKQAAMKGMEVKYADRLMKLSKNLAEGSSEVMKVVLSEKDAEMLTILTPEEKFEYDVRLSQPAILLRMGMGDFEPTEQEFRGMFRALKKYTDEYGFNTVVQPGDTGPAAVASETMIEEFAAALGAERFREYQEKHVDGRRAK